MVLQKHRQLLRRPEETSALKRGLGIAPDILSAQGNRFLKIGLGLLGTPLPEIMGRLPEKLRLKAQVFPSRMLGHPRGMGSGRAAEEICGARIVPPLENMSQVRKRVAGVAGLRIHSRRLEQFIRLFRQPAPLVPAARRAQSLRIGVERLQL